jgi:hypothetical protein
MLNTNLEDFQSLAQPSVTIIEQRVHFALAEKVLDFASPVLCFDKCVYLV